MICDMVYTGRIWSISDNNGVVPLRKLPKIIILASTAGPSPKVDLTRISPTDAPEIFAAGDGNILMAPPEIISAKNAYGLPYIGAGFGSGKDGFRGYTIMYGDAMVEAVGAAPLGARELKNGNSGVLDVRGLRNSICSNVVSIGNFMEHTTGVEPLWFHVSVGDIWRRLLRFDDIIPDGGEPLNSGGYSCSFTYVKSANVDDLINSLFVDINIQASLPKELR